jgi:hypothetical protein
MRVHVEPSQRSCTLASASSRSAMRRWGTETVRYRRLGSASSKPVICCLAAVRRVGMIPNAANHEAANVIDNQDQANRLLRKLTEVLPLSALATPALLAHLRGRSSAAKITLDCVVTKVFYLGDEGGITCHVTFDEDEKEEIFLSPTLPLIAGSQLHARWPPTRNIASNVFAAIT